MTTFWILAAVMTAVALIMILPPLFGRSRHAAVSRKALNLAIFHERLAELEQEHREGGIDDEEFAQGRNEIERELIYDLDHVAPPPTSEQKSASVSALVVGIAVPLVAVLGYLQIGNPEALGVASTDAMAGMAGENADHPSGEPGQQMPSVDEMVAGLARRLETEPDNLQGWLMLGRSYLIMEKFTQARKAFARAYELASDDPDVLTRYAESIAMSRQGRLVGKPTELLDQALKILPEHKNALWLSGLAARQQGDYAKAVVYWEKLKGLVGPEDAELLSQQIAEARAEPGDIRDDGSKPDASDEAGGL